MGRPPAEEEGGYAVTHFWQFLALLGVHWFADFALQTPWQAANKSKRLDALARHVAGYTAALLAAAILLFGWRVAIGFALVNGALHFATDYFTSRWSSRLFAPAMRDTARVIDFTKSYGHGPTDTDMRLMDVDPTRHWHNFFVVIGVDQLIHQVTLALTIAAFSGAFR